jgi:DNA-binding MarR family transcriptional regulator
MWWQRTGASPVDAKTTARPLSKRAGRQRALERVGKSFLDGFLLYHLSVVSNMSSRVLSDHLDREVGLSIPEWRVILIIGKIPGLSTDQVAARTTMDKTKVSRAIARLGALGYIDRQISASDRRQNRLEITPVGIPVFERCLVVASNVQTEVLRSLTAAEEKAFLAFLLKIESGIGAILEKAGPDE